MGSETDTTPIRTLPHRATVGPVLRIGLIAGTLDILENLIFNHLRGITVKMVFQYIASGLIGSASFRAGPASVALGVLLHYSIALTWTAILFAASRRFEILSRRPILCGLIYGVLVYSFMNAIVLPLSAVPHAPAARTISPLINGVLAVLLCIGVTISVLTARAIRNLVR